MFRSILGIVVAFIALACGLVEPVCARPKTDVVVLLNGDRITCEIKSLSRGKVKVGTDSMGNIDIEWLDIVAIKSDYYFRVETSNGKRFFGALELREGTTTLRISSMGAIIGLEKVSVVEILPIRQSFWQKMDGSLSIGFSYTRASDVAEFTFNWANRYVTERNLFDLGATTIMTDRGDSTDVARRIDLTFSYARLLKKKWTGNTSITAARNDELALARQLLLTLTSGFSPIKNNHDILMFSAGLALNSELSTNGNRTESLEGVLSGSFSRFNYNTPKTDINTAMKFYPSLTEQGRYRFKFDLKLRREIVKDLFFDLTYYLDYDSQSSEGTGQKRDYGIVTSIGWSY